MDIRAHIFIEGRVQGVFYRAWTLRAAENLDLTGWIKNLTDGRVEAVFEGHEEKVKEMVERCKKGSKVAKVKHMDVMWKVATGEFKNFQIVA